MSANTKWIEDIGPESSVEHAARRSLEPRLTAVAHLMPMAAHLAEHDIEHVHRLRVATRRATAALKLYWDCLPRSRRWMKKRLRKIRRAAGDARDLDVLADRLASDYGEAVAPVIDLIAGDRTAVQPAILRVVEKCRKRDRFVRKTAKLLRGIDVPKPPSDSNRELLFRDWAPKQFAKVAGEFTSATPNKSSDTVALHNFRIRSKALRYAIELVSPAFGPELRDDLYPTIEKLQERLGKIQDHVAAIERCQKWAAASRSEILRETLRELSDAEQRGLTDSIQSFHGWWDEDRISHVCSLLQSQTNITPCPPPAHQT
ncbi:MAG TPA: CHAD domain-containing protein [Lacipirellulaceae bacterium]|jgi:CHAD domain-containing protein|nr:CHAD domain-containing protein [Lacipirellulaceae bacterium]